MLHRLSSQTLAEKTGVSGHNTNPLMPFEMTGDDTTATTATQ